MQSKSPVKDFFLGRRRKGLVRRVNHFVNKKHLGMGIVRGLKACPNCSVGRNKKIKAHGETLRKRLESQR